MERAPNLRPSAFAGTSAAYLRFRAPYPRRMMAALLASRRTASNAVLLDLASGPGRVALDLASSVERVYANDLEPEMIAAGRKEAARRGIGNVEWIAGRAEELEVPPSSIDLISIGEAFHRLDQAAVLEKALIWLKPGGCLVTLGTKGILDGGEPWKERVAEIARRWFPAGWAPGLTGAALDRGAVESLLLRMGFCDVESRDFIEPREWSIDEILGYLRSTSVCSEMVLGTNFDAFEGDVRSALAGQQGAFHEASCSGYTLGRKPC